MKMKLVTKINDLVVNMGLYMKFYKKEVGVIVQTPEEFGRLMEFLDLKGWKWRDDYSPLDVNYIVSAPAIVSTAAEAKIFERLPVHYAKMATGKLVLLDEFFPKDGYPEWMAEDKRINKTPFGKWRGKIKSR